MRFIGIYILLWLSIVSVRAQELEIGILRSYSVSKVLFSHNNGVYEVFGDSTYLTSIWKEQNITIKRSGDGINVLKGDQDLGTFDTVFVTEKEPNSSFKIKCLAPASHKERKYMGNILVFPESSAMITVVNRIEMSSYLSGVIESEGGGGKHIEYYKVQAILSRTYALDHLKKHQKEGFQLCDNVHCQAYHNMMRYTPNIDEAVKKTRGVVMIDEDLNLAKGFFFANCGGQTSESDFVWNRPVSYCRSVQDTFCIHSKQANWTKKIKKSTWKNYLVSEFGYPVEDSLFKDQLYTFHQESRHAFYITPLLGIPLRDMRKEFNLKSTWFSCHPEGDYVILEGHGFGHGVGLCQEGAMKMANLGYDYEQILKFYFTGIELMNYYQWLFLHQQESQEGL